MDINAIRHERGEVVNAMRALLDKAESQNRDLTAAEQREYDTLDKKQQTLQARIEREDHTQKLCDHLDESVDTPSRPLIGNGKAKTSGQWEDTFSGKSISVYGKGQPIEIPKVQGPSLGDTVRGMFLGPKGNSDIKNALSVGTDSAGGYHVPEHLVLEVIEHMRSKSRVLQAGAQLVPLPANPVKMTRIATEPTPSWRAEAAAVSESDPTFEQVTFTPNSVDLLVKASIEVLEDSPNFNDIIMKLLSDAIALEIDRAALFGSGASNEPTGLFNQSNVLETDLGTNGAQLAQADLRTALEALYTNNAPAPSAAIMHPRTYFDIDGWAATDNQPLMLSKALQAVPMLETTQVPIDQTHGTATDASTILMGDFSQMVIGVRTALDLQVANELYRANGQVGFFARARYDVQLLQPKAFNKVTGIIP